MFSWLYLNGLLEINVESVAGAIRIKLGLIFRKYAPQSLQFNAHAIIRRTIRRAVQSKADDENSLVNAELNTIAATSIAPLIASVRGRLEPMTDLSLQASPRFAAASLKKTGDYAIVLLKITAFLLVQ